MTTPDPSIKIDRSTGRSSEQSICQGQKNVIKTKIGQTGPIEEIKTFVPRVTGRTVATKKKNLVSRVKNVTWQLVSKEDFVLWKPDMRLGIGEINIKPIPTFTVFM